jgi:hypothetical protein
VLDDIAAEEARADEAASGEPEAGGDGAAAPRSDS